MNFSLDVSWALFGVSALSLGIYEARAHRIGRVRPEQLARYANAQARMHWVAALSAQPGFEIVAVQTLRNSLMSATISASTAALAGMGSVSLAGATLSSQLEHWSNALSSPSLALHVILQSLLVLALFSSYVCSAMAMRHYGHAGFIMSMPVASVEKAGMVPAAADHVRRAGLLYSWGLRLFLFAAPIVAGVVHPYLMPFVTGLLLVALHFFDQPAAQLPMD